MGVYEVLVRRPPSGGGGGGGGGRVWHAWVEGAIFWLEFLVNDKNTAC